MAIQYRRGIYSKILSFAVICHERKREYDKNTIPGSQTKAKVSFALMPGICGGSDKVLLTIYPYKAKKGIQCFVDVMSEGFGLRPVTWRRGHLVEKEITPELAQILQEIADKFSY